MLGIGRAPKLVFHVAENAVHARGIRRQHSTVHFIKQCRRLLRLAALPVIVKIPAGKCAHDNDEQPGDGIAVLLPEMLDLVKLFLFFKV